jgi:hypothetical protein
VVAAIGGTNALLSTSACASVLDAVTAASEVTTTTATTTTTTPATTNAQLLPTSLLLLVFSFLSAGDCVQSLQSVSTRFRDAANTRLERICQRNSWRAPRRPRGAHRFDASVAEGGGARAVYLQYACAQCCQTGEYPVRKAPYSYQVFLLCHACVFEDVVTAKLTKLSWHIDKIGVNGKPLIASPRRRRRKKARLTAPTSAAAATAAAVATLAAATTATVTTALYDEDGDGDGDGDDYGDGDVDVDAVVVGLHE